MVLVASAKVLPRQLLPYGIEYTELIGNAAGEAMHHDMEAAVRLAIHEFRHEALERAHKESRHLTDGALADFNMHVESVLSEMTADPWFKSCLRALDDRYATAESDRTTLQTVDVYNIISATLADNTGASLQEVPAKPAGKEGR